MNLTSFSAIDRPSQYDILIVGASVRAAASTAVRAGYRPWCADQFADRDLACLCPVERIEAGSKGLELLLEIVDAIQPTPWFYTGGLENHPAFIERVSRRHPLWGVGPVALADVRNPERVADLLHSAGIACPLVKLRRNEVPSDGTWLSKPLASGGGIGIETYHGTEVAAQSPRYYQQQVEGDSYSALYVGAKSSALLVGVTRQLTGILGSPFLYRGNVGPVTVSPNVGEQLEHLGHCLTRGFGLEGWFGVDYVSDGETLWPVEVNPRFTASVEIHELAWRRPLLPIHRAACEGKNLAALEAWGREKPAVARCVGKCVVYAAQELEIGEIGWKPTEADDRFVVPEIADIPWAGTPFRPGDPVLSVFATGTDMEECESRLLSREREWRHRLKLDA
jgi:predicted ATP-grasp superfamily ATP-dependent carboligase